jgi:hypothetical protein
MSGSRLAKTPLCAAAVLSIISVAAVGCGKSGTATQNSALTNKAQATVTQTVTAPTVELTHAKAIVAADTICETSARKVAPQIAKMDAVRKSNVSKHEMILKLAPPVEVLAAETRAMGRGLRNLQVQLSHSDWASVRPIASTLFELAVIEEQLSQGMIGVERPRIARITRNVGGIRARERKYAIAFGARSCGLKPQTYVG